MYSITEAAVNRKRTTDKYFNAFPSYFCLPAPVKLLLCRWVQSVV